MLRHLYARHVAGNNRQYRSTNADQRSYADTAQSELLIALAEQEPATNAHGEDGTYHPRRRHGMHKLRHGCAGKCHIGKTNHLVAHRFGVKAHTYGVLHPSVGHENPPSGNRGAQAGKPRRRQVKLAAYFVPTKEHHGNKRSLHKEGKNTLDSQRSAEDVAHKPRVVAPVGAKFKFEDQARSHADREVDTKELHPKLRSALPDFSAFHDVDRLHNSHNHGEAERQRHKKPVIAGRKRKLRPRPVK